MLLDCKVSREVVKLHKGDDSGIMGFIAELSFLLADGVSVFPGNAVLGI